MKCKTKFKLWYQARALNTLLLLEIPRIYPLKPTLPQIISIGRITKTTNKLPISPILIIDNWSTKCP